MKLTSYLCLLLCVVLTTTASADESVDLKEKAKILNQRLNQNGTNLHQTLKIFYSRAVICF